MVEAGGLEVAVTGEADTGAGAASAGVEAGAGELDVVICSTFSFAVGAVEVEGVGSTSGIVVVTVVLSSVDMVFVQLRSFKEGRRVRKAGF